GRPGCLAQAGQEALQVLCQPEVGLLVEELGCESVDGALQAGLFGPQVGHTSAQLAEGDQVLLVGLYEPADRFGSACQVALEPGAFRSGRVGGAQLCQAPVELALDEGGVGQQGSNLSPYDLVEVVGAHRLVLAHPAPLVAVVGVAAGLAGDKSHEQAGLFAVAGGETAVVGQAAPGELEGGLVDDRGHGDGDPLLFRAVVVGVG